MLASQSKAMTPLTMYVTKSVKEDRVSSLLNNVFVDSNCNLMAFTSAWPLFGINTDQELELILYIDNISTKSEDRYNNIGDQPQSLCPGE